MLENDKDVWVGENHTYLGEDNILYTTVVGEVDESKAKAIRDAHLKFLSMVEGKVNSLVDLNKAGKQPPAARKIGKDMFEHERIGKIALFGLHPVARVIASFVIGVTRKKEIRFFKTREEAIAWLKEPDEDSHDMKTHSKIVRDDLRKTHGDG